MARRSSSPLVDVEVTINVPAGPLHVKFSPSISGYLVVGPTNNNTPPGTLCEWDTILSLDGVDLRGDYDECHQRIDNSASRARTIVVRRRVPASSITMPPPPDPQHHPPPPSNYNINNNDRVVDGTNSIGDGIIIAERGILDKDDSDELDAMGSELGSDFDLAELKFSSLNDCLSWVSKHVCKMHAPLHEFQTKALEMCLNPTICGSKLLLVTRTGSGKSHVMKMLGAMVGGVVVIIVPLLALSADQMKKMKKTNQDYGPFEVHHPDEIPSNRINATLPSIVQRIDSIKKNDTRSTIILFVSPQLLVKKSSKPLLDALIRAHKRTMLRAIGIDEAHLFVQHSTFRIAIRMLKNIFFLPLFPPDNTRLHPIFIAASATMTKRYVERLEELTSIKLPPKCRLWPPPEHFRQRNIKMESSSSNNYASKLDRSVAVVTNSEKNEEHSSDEAVVVLTTLATQAIDVHKKLGEKLDKKGSDADVVLVHGRQDKHEKFIGMGLFCNKVKFKHFNPRLLVTNGAGNTGIDYDRITDVLRIGWVPDLITALQERGRLVRLEGMKGRILYVYNINSLLQILFLLYDSSSNNSQRDDGVPDAIRGMNSAIRHSARLSSSSATDDEAMDDEDEIDAAERKKYALTDTQKKQDLNEKTEMLLDAMKFFCLDFGCWHVRAEAFMSTGELGRAPVGIDRCGNMCPICDRTWHTKQHRPVSKENLIAWFRSSDFYRHMPLSAKDNTESLTNLLWNGKETWIFSIFKLAKSTLNKYNVECLMQSLIAAKIIKWNVTKSKGVEWDLNSVTKLIEENETSHTIEKQCYEIDSYWEGINLHDD